MSLLLLFIFLVCPAGWKPGKDTIKPDVQQSKEYFSKQQWNTLECAA